MPQETKAPGRVTIRDLARDLGVSRSTISRAFQADSRIADVSRETVLMRANELGYKPNPFARGLTGKNTKIVGVLVSRMFQPLFSEILSQVANQVSKNSMTLMLVAAEHLNELRDGIDALMVYDPTVVLVFSSYASADQIAEAPVPHEKIVYFNRPPKRAGSIGVVYDNFVAGETAAAHLIGLGHRRLAYLSSGLESYSDQEQGRGFATYCRAQGLDIPKVVVTGGFGYDDAAAAAAEVAAHRDDLDAIFCASDFLGLGLLDTLRYRHGVDVPGELSIIGCGDLAMTAWPSHAMTTIRLPRRRMADELVRLIEAISSGQRPSEALIRVPPSGIVERQSTAPKTVTA